ncbi:MAG: hypothetical protein AB7N71_04970 [Phycisphaerae bacterium]
MNNPNLSRHADRDQTSERYWRHGLGKEKAPIATTCERRSSQKCGVPRESVRDISRDREIGQNRKQGCGTDPECESDSSAESSFTLEKWLSRSHRSALHPEDDIFVNSRNDAPNFRENECEENHVHPTSFPVIRLRKSNPLFIEVGKSRQIPYLRARFPLHAVKNALFLSDKSNRSQQSSSIPVAGQPIAAAGMSQPN